MMLKKKPDDALLSHAATHAVPSAKTGLTSVFGMGTGVAPTLISPGYTKEKERETFDLKVRRNTVISQSDY